MRTYSLPDQIPGESNGDWCRRAADAIPPEVIVAELIRKLDREEKRRRYPTWSVIGEIIGHGSGVSAAVVEKYRALNR